MNKQSRVLATIGIIMMVKLSSVNIAYSLSFAEQVSLASGMQAASYETGKMNFAGVEPHRLYETANKIIHEKAKEGDLQAQFTLWAMYVQGIGGVQQDLKEAVKWCREAAEHGHAGRSSVLE